MRAWFASPGMRREAVIALLAFGAVAVATYGQHVFRGGWYYDDWAFITHLDLAKGGGIDAVWRASQDISYRPGYCVTFFLMYLVGRTGQAPYLLMGVAIVAVQGTLLYLLLRRLRATWYVAAAAAAILVVVPAVDATRIWTAATPSGVALALYLAGVLCALHGLDVRRRRPSIAWHAAAAVLYVAGMLTSELVAPLVLLAVVLYAFHGGWRRALRRLPVDVVVTGATLAYLSDAATDYRPVYRSLSHMFDRVPELWRAGVPVFRGVLPLDGVIWGPVGLLVLCLAAGGVGFALARGDQTTRIRAELVLTATGFVFMLAGLAMLLPADPYYVPRSSGVADRFAIAAAPGFAVFVAGVAALVARGISTLVSRPAVRIALFAVLAGAAAVSMAIDERRIQSTWAESWKQAQNVIGAVKHAVGPDVPPGSQIITFHHPTTLPGDVPVFQSNWDLLGAMHFTYRDTSIGAHAFLPGLLRCDPEALTLTSPPGSGTPMRLEYENLYFVDVATYTAKTVAGQQACTRQLALLGT